MLIPSIDLMGGKIVQLVQGERKALEFDDFSYWIERFSSYPLVQLIDLDAAMGKGSNQQLVATICKSLPCQIGGGIRTRERAQELLDAGARRVIFGSALLKQGAINTALAQECATALGSERLTFAIDSRAGKVAIHGWTQVTEITPVEMIAQLEPYCSAFLYTHIDTEGTMTGFPVDVAKHLRKATERQLIVAGGIRSTQEVDALDALHVDAVVGMAIYTGVLNDPQPRRTELRPGDSVVLAHAPAGLLDGLAIEDQDAISAIVGKPVLLAGFDEIGRAELEFHDRNGVMHFIWVNPDLLRKG